MTKLSDVARYVGVSNGTVSLAINGSPLVKEATRKKVLEAVELLGYVPNASARSLVTHKQLVIGVVRCVDNRSENAWGFEDTIDTYLSDMLVGIERESVSQGYSLMVDWSPTLEAGAPLPSLYTGGKADGVLMAGGLIAENLPERLAQTHLPTVLVGSRSDHLDWVDADVAEAMRQAVHCLYDHGHREIAFLNGPDTSRSSPTKLEGFLRGMAECSLPVKPEWLVKGNFSGEGGYQAMRTAHERGGLPGAAVAAVDCMAVGAQRYLHGQGLSCPGDVSLIGYEDGLLAEYALPPLTTMSAQKQEIGHAACRMLMERILNPELPHRTLLIPPRLVTRQSIKNLLEGKP